MGYVLDRGEAANGLKCVSRTHVVPNLISVSPASLSSAVSFVCRFSGDEHAGLRSGMKLQPQQWGAVGYAAMSAPNGVAALKLLDDFQSRLMGGIALRHDIEVNSLRVSGETGGLPRDYGFWSFLLASRLSFIRAVCGNTLAPELVRLPCDPPVCDHALRTMVGGDVGFGADAYSERFGLAAIAESNPSSHPAVHDAMAAIVRRERQEVEGFSGNFSTSAEGLRSFLMDEVGKSMDGGATLTIRDFTARLRLADDLGGQVSTRQLQRRLASAQCGFRDMVGDVRKNRVLTLLRSTNKPLGDIAAEAGYAELSSFYRAVRRWFGMTPMQIREGRAM